ncbi:hypothetical protein Q4491_08670 [Photobacterium sp. 2_MG-2023]|uniref:hypothetical protein n=1 Tax=Photobacterium TaxID=657 RepID=UPI0026E2704A|nr:MULTISPECIES: hypothetical protein [Photobacterium]MDO6581420.1 hypothetical protein [Photobacterium sp. 2_MG-2023]
MNFIFRVFEEVFPIFTFLKSKKNISNKVNDRSETASKSERYKELGSDSLNIRIKEEHERAVKIDEKTFKFTLGLSVSLTVLAAASGSFVKFSPNNPFSIYISILCGISSLYMLSAGITALGAIKTLATYGYGTDHLLSKNKIGDSYLAEALYAQERMNIIRQLRNESAYQSLRNGFLLLFLALCLAVVMLGNSNNVSTPTKINTEDASTKVKSTELNNRMLVFDEKIDNNSMQ